MNKKFKITKKLLLDLSESRVYVRGEEYFEDGMVEALKWDGKSYQAIVEGSYDYDVEITVDENGDIDFFCSCPYNWGGICKHCVAVGLTIIREPGKIEKISKKQIQNEKIQVVKAESISLLIKQANQEQKDEFLTNLLQKDNNLQQQFEVFIKGELGVDSSIVIDLLRKNLIEKLENLNFSRRHLMNNIPESNDRYYDEWDAYYDAAIIIIRRKFQTELQQIDSFMKNGLHLESLKILLALYEAIGLFKDNYDDFEYDVIDSVEDEVFLIWKKYFNALIKKSTDFQTEIKNACIELLSQRISKNRKLYSFHHFRDFLMNLLAPDTVDLIEKNILSKFIESETAVIRMDIAETRKDEEKWLQIAEKFYSEQPDIGDRYLDYFEKKQMKKEFIQRAKILFKKWSPIFAKNIYDFLDYEDDEQLFQDVLFFLAKEKNEMKYFQDLRKIADDKTMNDLLEEIKKKHNYIYLMQVLEEVEKFSEIRDFFDKYLDYWNFDSLYKPIINVYPQHCFDKIKNYAEKELKSSGSRNHYRHIALKIKWLYKIEDKSILDNVKKWVSELLQKYIRRPAMLDEFRKEGIE